MTCIVGLATDGRVVLGGDSAGVIGMDLIVRADAKVFRKGPMLMGFTSSFRMGQLLKYRLAVPCHPEPMGAHEYMSTLFVDAVRQCLKDGGYARKNNEEESGGVFIAAYRGTIYTVCSDYQVGEHVDGYAAVGCAESVALGVLWATRDGPDPVARVRLALEAAEHFSAGVRAPFVVLEGAA